ncbi:MAG: hypothetical protein ABW128_15535 [Rhizorhabdus sp.]
MAEVQTTYSNTIAKAYAGMVANGETSNRITRTNESATAIPFGQPVYRGTGDHGCTPTIGTLGTFYGWSIATMGQALIAGQTADTYAQYDNVPIMTLGAIYVAVKGSVVDGAAITVGTGGGAADLIGSTAADATHIATGWFADETVTDGLCRIYRR